jgi:hypothetical protein
VRTKTILLGAIAALALATLSVNAATGTTHRVQGSVVSLVAATTAVAKADREVETIAAHSSAAQPTSEPIAKRVVAATPATPRTIAITSGCQQAIAALKAMHTADVTEDTAERAATPPLSASALLADRSEDTAEAQRWTTVLTAARTACVPQPSTACQSAIASLQALLQANRTEDLGEWTTLRTINWPSELTTLKTAFGTAATACADRD